MSFEQMKAKRLEDEAKRDELQRIAYRQGLVIVQKSSRSYFVVKFSGGRGYSSIGQHGPRTVLSGEIVFGPDKYQACTEYVAENTEPPPGELL